jgi:mRNA interferase HicA
MKRQALVRRLEAHGREFLREGANHTVYVNRGEKKATTIPRHREIDDDLCKKICKDVGIPKP